jgi:hypothetical protein
VCIADCMGLRVKACSVFLLMTGCRNLHEGIVEVLMYHPVMSRGVSECKLKLQFAGADKCCVQHR